MTFHIGLFQSLRLLKDQPLLFQKPLVAHLADQADLIADLRKSLICVVLPKQQPVLGSRSHHAVRLVAFFCHEIVDQHADVRLGPVQYDPLFSLQLSRRIDAGHQPLGRRLLIAGTAVKLSPAEESVYIPEFQRGPKLPGVDAVVLDGVGVRNDLCVFKTRHCAVHLILHIFRKGAGHAADVHFVRLKPLRLNEYLVPLLIGKFDNLILNGRAVPGPCPLDHAGKERGSVRFFRMISWVFSFV